MQSPEQKKDYSKFFKKVSVPENAMIKIEHINKEISLYKGKETTEDFYCLSMQVLNKATLDYIRKKKSESKTDAKLILLTHIMLIESLKKECEEALNNIDKISEDDSAIEKLKKA